jgi:hypothetical protein
MVPRGSDAVSRDVVRNHGREEFATDIVQKLSNQKAT